LDSPVNNNRTGKNNDERLQKTGKILYLAMSILVLISGGCIALRMAMKFMEDMKTSRRLSRAEETTAIEPEPSPMANLLEASARAVPAAKSEAFCLISMRLNQNTDKYVTSAKVKDCRT
jgi:hypothetical protein